MASHPHTQESEAVRSDKQRIVVFGNSIYAEHVYYLLTYDSDFEIVAFTVDKDYITKDKLMGLPVVPFEQVEEYFPPAEYGMMVSISFQRVNRLREEKYLQAKTKGYNLVSYVSPTAKTYPGLEVGENTLIMENVIIGPFARIGNDVVIASGSIIGHHAVVRDHAFVSNSVVVLGGVSIGEYSLVGANSTIREDVRVAPECIIGSNVSITKHTQDKGVYVNPPVKLHPKRSDEMQTWMTWPLRQSGRGGAS